MFGTGFEPVDIMVSGVRIHGVRGGEGPPVLLLHGFPQSHVMWHRIAPELAREYTVVAGDLRGYGDSDRPEAGPDHAGYAFRAMAADQVALMEALGFPRFAVVAHGLRLRARRPPSRDVQLPLVLPEPARRSAGAADRRRPALLPAPLARQLGQRAGRARARGAAGVRACVRRPRGPP